jgi:hypothetical protein
MAALLKAARDKLREDMPIPPGQSPKLFVGIQPGWALPKPRGQWFVALDEANVTSTEKVSLKEEYAIEVKIVKEVGRYAPDQTGQMYLDHSPGLDELERQVIRSLHNNHTLRQMANENAGAPSAGDGDIFQSPLWYRGRGRTSFGDLSLERTLSFSGARRVQAVDVMN